MKKSLIALAAVAAVGAASAQSSVTLYGIVDIGYSSQTTKSKDGVTSNKSSGILDGAQSGNRIGFRGTEDLGGGLKANFVIEQGISPTSGNLFTQRAGAAGNLIQGLAVASQNAALGATGVSGAGGAYTPATNRQSYLGLSSASFGTLNLGFNYTNAYELSTLSGYTISSEGIPGGDKAHLFGLGAVGGGRANGITYISPAFGGGFTVRAQYGANGPATQSQQVGAVVTAANRFGLMGQYANGPLSAALAYTTMKTNSSLGGAVVASNFTGNLTQLGASYDFGVAKLGGTYTSGKNGGIPTVVGVNNAYRSYQLGVSAPFGAFTPFFAFGRAKNTEKLSNVLVEDYKTYQIGARYALSKRTTAYAFYGKTSDSSPILTNAQFDRDSKFVTGINHSF